MLGSTLTAEDEEEVEKELLQLQKEAGAVRRITSHAFVYGYGPYVPVQVQEEAPERPIVLPSAPTTEPKVEEPEQEGQISITNTADSMLTNVTEAEEVPESRERVPVLA